MPVPTDSSATIRRSAYVLLIALGVGTITGRILSVNAVDKISRESYRINEAVAAAKKRHQESGLTGPELAAALDEDRQKYEERFREQRPFLSGNDRSRWATIRALVDNGTYSIDEVIAQRGWDTIDMVQHRDEQGEQRLYSSKPALLPTLLAGEYWLVHRLTGATLEDDPFYVVRLMLLTINVVPLAIAWWLLALICERYGQTDWGRLLVMAAATFGTLLTMFAVVLNNHLVAAVSSIAALYPALRIWYDGERRWRYFFLAGLFAAFTAANELPALTVFALLGAGLLWCCPRQTLVGFVPGAAIVAAAFFATEYLAHGTFRPAYAHRQAGPLVEGGTWDASRREALDASAASPEGRPTAELLAALEEIGIQPSDQARVIRWTTPLRRTRSEAFDKSWKIEDPAGDYAVLNTESGPEVHVWDDWYDYRFYAVPPEQRAPRYLKTSYWSENQSRSKIDRGEPSVGVYALHALVGHHGIFSLTPVWLLSVVGVVLLVRRRPSMWHLAVLVAIPSLVCFAFYLSRPVEDRNYGGTSSGLRWMLWFAPLWLVAMLPAADATSRSRPLRGLAIVLLVFSALSAAYPSWNPWQHPWLWNWFDYQGWIETK